MDVALELMTNHIYPSFPTPVVHPVSTLSKSWDWAVSTGHAEAQIFPAFVTSKAVDVDTGIDIVPAGRGVKSNPEIVP